MISIQLGGTWTPCRLRINVTDKKNARTQPPQKLGD
ncbi:hypothetical protein PC129_g5468 [Phytophthora cactorum]|uniref:Uncharacterized protein n=1 Tax=Phytophthora cactorum TaxID=29920 RepID=A0A8T1II74_9STRA|nr:hypothetical protein Pcac1_g3581 [Phytophthora cactorum]KAG2856043.1 hypothetical protein PC114_g28563 [Phytophthora cactorum]KAG2870883.1 hypothetical protein PC117_g28390 [Phytophthora cactorum]KAG2955343.1 hypothetical protein PC119_g27910 [Phytophthora cactorum]KAG2958080.1 hypothetical protein PC120_g28385 [Phytophthora cactorum]